MRQIRLMITHSPAGEHGMIHVMDDSKPCRLLNRGALSKCQNQEHQSKQQNREKFNISSHKDFLTRYRLVVTDGTGTGMLRSCTKTISDNVFKRD